MNGYPRCLGESCKTSRSIVSKPEEKELQNVKFLNRRKKNSKMWSFLDGSKSTHKNGVYKSN